MGPRFSKAYVAIPPPVLEGMTLRQIEAHLVALAPAPIDETEALIRQHPGVQGRS